jgi:hypothetical protein
MLWRTNPQRGSHRHDCELQCHRRNELQQEVGSHGDRHGVDAERGDVPRAQRNRHETKTLADAEPEDLRLVNTSTACA